MRWRAVAVLLALLALVALVTGIPRPQEDEEGEDEDEDEEEDEEDEDGEEEGLVGGHHKKGHKKNKNKKKRRGGGVKPSFGEETNKRSNEYFEKIKKKNAPTVRSKNLQLYQSPVKDQGSCPSSVAFATTAAVEGCFMRLTGIRTVLSEQQLLDCAYGFQGANGCEPTPLFSYLEWVATTGRTLLVSDVDYPYRGVGSPFECDKTKPVAKAGALVQHYDTNVGSEEQMRKVLDQNNEVITAVCFSSDSLQAFKNYTGGIFSGCAADNLDPAGATCQAVTVVGYGSEQGVAYWLVRNSWGPTWGEEGYFRLQRDTGMCQVAKSMGVVTCTKYDGTRILVAATCEGGEEECGQENDDDNDEVEEQDEEEEDEKK